jgi:hypothetical protein
MMMSAMATMFFLYRYGAMGVLRSRGRRLKTGEA